MRNTRYSKLASSAALTLCVISSAASADALFSRLEAATEQLAENTNAFYLSKAPELKGKLPPAKLDDDFRKATGCVLDGIRTQKGNDVAEDYVESIESVSKVQITSFEQMADLSDLPESIDNQLISSLMRDCKVIDVSTKRLKESGAWEVMQDPAVMQKLMDVQ